MQRSIIPVSALSIGLLLSGCSTMKQSLELQQESLELQKQTLSEIAQLEKRMALLEASLAKQDEQDEAFEARLEYLTSVTREYNRSYCDIESLARIPEPLDQSEENVKKYITQILVTSSSQHSRSSGDTQVMMLSDLGEEQLPLLLKSLGTASPPEEAHLRYAITKLANEDSKDMILDAFRKQPESSGLLSIVTQKKWTTDAKDTLIANLEKSLANTSSSHINSAVFRAIAEMEDPETYPLLLDCFVKKSGRLYSYPILKKLPGIELDEAVLRAWETVGNNSESERISVASLAMPLGEKSALEELVGKLGQERRSTSRPEPRMVVLAHIDFSGSDEEIKDWYFSNRENIVFDADRKRFHIGETSPSAPAKPTEAE